MYVEGAWWARYSESSEDKPSNSGAAALAESSGGFTAMERVRYPSTPPNGTEIFEATTSLVVGDRATSFLWLDN
jgi:hypothetical protein